MLKHDPSLEMPDVTAALWRYLSYSEFRSLLETKHLCLVRCDQLDDGWDSLHQNTTSELFYDGLSDFSDRRTLEARIRQVRLRSHTSCWQIQDRESATAWDQQPRRAGPAIAIRSSIERMTRALAWNHPALYPGMSKHCKRATEIVPLVDLQIPLARKRDELVYERELRLIHQDSKWTSGRLNSLANKVPTAVFAPVRLDALFESIHICPSAGNGWVDHVRELCQAAKMKGLPIVQSMLFRRLPSVHSQSSVDRLRRRTPLSAILPQPVTLEFRTSHMQVAAVGIKHQASLTVLLRVLASWELVHTEQGAEASTPVLRLYLQGLVGGQWIKLALRANPQEFEALESIILYHSGYRDFRRMF